MRHHYLRDASELSADEYEVNGPAGDLEAVVMDTDELNIDLSCPICLGVCSKAVTTIECLHRFCAACIEKSLRLGLKECPTCREKCPSRRFLRPDPNFDALISVIYPNLKAWEEEETKRIEVLNRQNSANHQELLKNLRDMKDQQKLVRKQRAGKADYVYTGPEILHTAASWPNIGVTVFRSAGCNTIGRLDDNELSMPPNSTISNLGDYVRYKLQVGGHLSRICPVFMFRLPTKKVTRVALTHNVLVVEEEGRRGIPHGMRRRCYPRRHTSAGHDCEWWTEPGAVRELAR